METTSKHVAHSATKYWQQVAELMFKTLALFVSGQSQKAKLDQTSVLL